MIRTLLIANRGEIVCRIARTAHRMGVSTVGVYTQTDVDSLHVDAVDQSVALHGPSATAAYLDADAIIEAARTSGADAIHPGYGFLAESAAFAQRVVDAGLCWVGPTPEQIRLLGDKIAAKAAAVEAGVPTTSMFEVSPGQVPAGLTMPVLVKAAAGGGGRGMRIVRQHIDLTDAIESASREASAAFGDGTVFIEPYIERGRHVEVQIIGDAFGSVIHLGERECSIQRRNQKVLEEAPSPGISGEVRERLTDGALRLARHVGYENAGTVEFLVAADGTVNFLEVNTRLQVEHPVTEAVTGVDLVELQLRIASGERLPLEQEDIVIRGHAIEARIVAEDPASDWLPSIGTLAAFEVSEGVRVDAGVRSGSVVTPDFDSMLAKVIAHEPTRGEAAAVLARALRTSRIAGLRTNVDSTIAILEEVDFLAGKTTTSYLPEHPQVTNNVGPRGNDLRALLLAATFMVTTLNRNSDTVTGFAPSGWRNLRTVGQRRIWRLGDVEHRVEYMVRGETIDVQLGAWPESDDTGALPADDRSNHIVKVLGWDADSIVLEVDGVRTATNVVLDEQVAHTSSAAGSAFFEAVPIFHVHEVDRDAGGPICPLPGTVIAVHVEAGDEVAEGQLLMVVEAMKMEHKIVATTTSSVSEVLFSVGDRVDSGDLLVRLAEMS